MQSYTKRLPLNAAAFVSLTDILTWNCFINDSDTSNYRLHL